MNTTEWTQKKSSNWTANQQQNDKYKIQFTNNNTIEMKFINTKKNIKFLCSTLYTMDFAVVTLGIQNTDILLVLSSI